MLFQRLYNWIKYKTLPPSILFKNRLFIEKDNKNKRIVSNLGTSFRNTKWSNYATFNIKFAFKKNYISFLLNFFLFCILFLLAYGFWGYYMINPTYNTFVAFFWFGGEVLDYYVSYIFWFICSLFSIAFNTVYSYFFFNNFSKKNVTNFNFETKSFTKQFPQYPQIDKIDANWALTSFLTNMNAKLDKIMENDFVENLFDNILNFRKWNNTLDAYIILFKSTRLFNFVSSSKNALFANVYFQKLVEWDRKCNPYLLHFQIMKNSINFGTTFNKKYFPIAKNNTYRIFQNLKTKKKCDWRSLRDGFFKLKFLTDTKIGSFFLSKWSHGELVERTNATKDFSAVQTCFVEQIKIIKINRWIYRYSVLGRKILKNAHKLTMSKKILNFNFFAENDFNKNLWISQHSAKFLLSNTQNFNLFQSSDYNNLTTIKNKKINSNSAILSEKFLIPSKNALNLKFYETSFHWFLKRNYFLNSTRSAHLKFQKINFKNNLFLNHNNIFANKTLKDNYFLSRYQPSILNTDGPAIDEIVNYETTAFTKKSSDSYLGHTDLNFYDQSTVSMLSYFYNQTNSNQETFTFFVNLNTVIAQNPVFLIFLNKNISQNHLSFFNENTFLIAQNNAHVYYDMINFLQFNQ